MDFSFTQIITIVFLIIWCTIWCVGLILSNRAIKESQANIIIRIAQLEFELNQLRDRIFITSTGSPLPSIWNVVPQPSDMDSSGCREFPDLEEVEGEVEGEKADIDLLSSIRKIHV